MMVTKAESGGAVKITGTFVDGNGDPTNVTTPTVKIYDRSKTLLLTTTTGITNVSTGVYTYAYQTPYSETAASYFAEFSGTLDGLTVLGRVAFTTAFDI